MFFFMTKLCFKLLQNSKKLKGNNLYLIFLTLLLIVDCYTCSGVSKYGITKHALSIMLQYDIIIIIIPCKPSTKIEENSCSCLFVFLYMITLALIFNSIPDGCVLLTIRFTHFCFCNAKQLDIVTALVSEYSAQHKQNGG